ncbi:amidohydrolase [Actinomycetospora aeridis]|uniref:Amidohydrolase family protein n=1 Tax=Actinomycetospora aeridis TaxID=3129231 RepID=A0ABU8NE70_9PSEU
MSALLLRGARSPGSAREIDVRLADGHVASVTPVGEAEVRHGDEVVDARGTTVLPGLVDAHVHWTQWAQVRRRVDVGAARDPEEVATTMAGAATGGPGMVVGHGFRAALWSRPPHKEMLERAAPGVPIALVSDDLHAVWLSPAALVRLGREHPTGLLREHEAFAVMPALSAGPDVAELDRWVAAASAEAAARGLTAVRDFEYDDTVAAWSRRAADGGLALRVDAAVWEPWLAATLDRGHRTGDAVADLVRVGPFKILADGSLNTRTAACHHAYPDPGDGYGALNIDPGDLRDLMVRVARDGLHPAVHAIGDRANAVVLDAFAHVDGPGRVEHAQLVAPEDVARFARPGLVASVQPAHLVDDRDVAERHWPDATARAYPYADLVAAGARLELGSDAPVAAPDPWLAIAAAVARTGDERPPWHPEQSLDVATALRASCGGRLELRLGDPADVVLVEEDPLHADPGTLRAMPVRATVLAGRVTHRGAA